MINKLDSFLAPYLNFALLFIIKTSQRPTFRANPLLLHHCSQLLLPSFTLINGNFPYMNQISHFTAPPQSETCHDSIPDLLLRCRCRLRRIRRQAQRELGRPDHPSDLEDHATHRRAPHTAMMLRRISVFLSVAATVRNRRKPAPTSPFAGHRSQQNRAGSPPPMEPPPSAGSNSVGLASRRRLQLRRDEIRQ